MSVTTRLARSGPILRVLWPVWWVAMAVATHLPKIPGPPPSIPNADKIAHILIYFVLTLMGGRALISAGRISGTRGLWLWAAIYMAYGIVDEVTQPFVNRTMSFYDWLADGIGVMAATLILTMHFETNPEDDEADADAEADATPPTD